MARLELRDQVAREGVELEGERVGVGFDGCAVLVPVLDGVEDAEFGGVGDARAEVGEGDGVVAALQQLARLHREDGELRGVAEHAGGALAEEIGPVRLHLVVERLAVEEAVAGLEADVEREDAQLVDDVLAGQRRRRRARRRSARGRSATAAGPRTGNWRSSSSVRTNVDQPARPRKTSPASARRSSSRWRSDDDHVVVGPGLGLAARPRAVPVDRREVVAEGGDELLADFAHFVGEIEVGSHDQMRIQ